MDELQPTPGIVTACGKCGAEIAALPCPACGGDGNTAAIQRERREIAEREGRKST